MSITQVSPELEHDVQKVFESDSAELKAFRENAKRRYQELPAPHFDRSSMENRIYSFLPTEAEETADWQKTVESLVDLNGEHPLLVFVDDRLVHLGGLENLPKGVTVQTLRVAAQEANVVTLLGNVVPVDENKWTALQSAFWQNGVYIHAPKNAVVPGVIQVVHLTTKKGRGTFPRNLIIADANSQLSVLDLYVASDEVEEELHLGITEVMAAEGSQVSYGVITNFPKQTTSYWIRRAKAARDSRVDFTVGELGEGYTIGEFGSLLEGEGSSSNGHAVALGTGRAHMDLTAKMVHVAKFSQSDTSARGVMQGRADGVYRGVTHIQKGASGAVGEQSERLLMLSPKSRADAIPMLLIDENDVKCGHAASVGQISEEQLFYLMSRGISEAEAKRMVVWGFLDPVLAALPVDRVRQAVVQVLERKMN